MQKSCLIEVVTITINTIDESIYMIAMNIENISEYNKYETNKATAILLIWTFRQHKFSCYHQQGKQGSFQFCIAVLTVLMTTAESRLSKRPVTVEMIIVG